MVADAGDKLLIVDYSTTWCGPCKMMAPKFDDMSNRYTQAVSLNIHTCGPVCAAGSRAHHSAANHLGRPITHLPDPVLSRTKHTIIPCSPQPQVFVKVVGDSTPEAGQLLKREGVRSVPAFHFWKGGKRVDSISGADPERLEEAIMSNL